MPEGILLMDRTYYDSAEWLNQKHDGFGRGAAWQDLLALTNQKKCVARIRNQDLPLERGQCAYSKLGLADRWGRSQGWVTATLTHWENSGRIKLEIINEATVINVLKFDDYQTGLARLLCEMTAISMRDDCESIETEKREERRENRGTQGEKGEGRGPITPTGEIPSDEQIATFCAAYPGDLARGIPAGIPEGWWSGWVANRISEKKWPADWQRVLVLAFRADFLNRHPKAMSGVGQNTNGISKKNAAPVNGARSLAQERFLAERELSEVRERLDACHETGAPPDAADVARESALEARVKELAEQVTHA